MRAIRVLSVFVLWLSAISALAQEAKKLSAQANDAYNQKDYAKSAELYAAAIECGDDDPGTFYNAACSFALRQQSEKAFQYLEKAIAQGWSNAEHLQKDSDLNGLHADARWPKLVEKCANHLKTHEAFWNNPALETSYRENLSDDEKVAGLSQLWSEAKYNFAYFHAVPQLDWDAAYLAYLPRVRQTGSTLEYYRVLMEFYAKLQDGHTNVAPPAELVNAMYARPAIRPRLIEDKILVIDVWDEQLRRNGITPGQELLEIDGIPVKPYAAERIRPYQCASTPQDLAVRTYEYALFWGAAQDSLRLTLKDKNGKSFKKILPRLTREERNKLIPPRPPFEFKLLPNNVAYVALNTFQDNQAAEQFEANFAVIAKAAALIIDVRENGGGNSNVGYRVLQTLTDKSFRTSRWQTRDYRPALRAWGRLEGTYGNEVDEIPPHGTWLYSKPVIVLTSPRTYSAAEDFCVAFEVMARGVMMGEPTGGSTGQPLFFKLPGGGNARVCTKRDTYPDGRVFVGVGIQPNKLVHPTVEDFRAGRDTVLEAALAQLKVRASK